MGTPMRIVLDLQACQGSSMKRGIGRYSLSLAQAMVRNAGPHEVRVVLNSRFASSVAPLRAAFEHLLPASHVSTFAVPDRVFEGDPANAWRQQAAERMREHYLATLQPSVVHVSSLFEGYGDDTVTSVLHGDGRFDSAVTLYDLIPLMRREMYLKDPATAAWYFRKLQSLKNAELLLAISAHSRQEALGALQLDPARVINISSAIDGEFRQRQLGHDERAALHARYGISGPFVMYTGGIDYRKNIEGLIGAFAALPPALRRAHQLAIVCNMGAADRLRLAQLAARAGLPPAALVLTGYVPDEDLIALYNDAALFVFPSLQEGFGLPALEAMACGAPVIGSDCSSIPEVIGRSDALFDPTSEAAITAGMTRVLGDPALTADLRRHGLEQARRFSWDASARAALEGFEQLHERRAASARVALTVPATVTGRRPRLAFVSPLPPARSGIAVYSAELLPELARYYDIELVLAQDEVSDAWATSNFPRRSVQWFDRHAAQFDHIVYQFGNSTFHQHMFALLERHPGIVVLHDFYLSGIVAAAEAASTHDNNYSRTLYLNHGYPALVHERDHGREASKLAHPCNLAVLEQAAGVIVHSAHAAALAASWYGEQRARGWRQIPLLRALPGPIDRLGARRALGIDADAFVLCSFGMLAPTKCNDLIIDAWLASPLAGDSRCHLVFVGENAASPFGEAVAAAVAAHPRISITGFADEASYRHYLAAADCAVQLRAHSRGETSATVLDCLANRLPTIINAHGSAAEVPADVCIKLGDVVTVDALAQALGALHGDAALRARLAESAGSYMAQVHHPARIGALYRDAIGQLTASSEVLAYRRLLAGLAALPGGAPAASDLRQVAACIAANAPRRGLARQLVDVTPCLAYGGSAALREYVLQDESRVEPVYLDGDQWRYARRFTLALIGRADLALEDAPLDAGAGDVLFSAAALPPAMALAGVQLCAPGPVLSAAMRQG